MKRWLGLTMLLVAVSMTLSFAPSLLTPGIIIQSCGPISADFDCSH